MLWRHLPSVANILIDGGFHPSDPWPLPGHPEGMKISRGPRLGPTSALLGGTKEPLHTSVRQEPHRHPKVLCLRARTSDS